MITFPKNSLVLLLAILGTCITLKTIADPLEYGAYFHKKSYQHEALPTFENSERLLPQPILDAHPDWIEMYWAAWKIAFSNLRQPPQGSPLVSNYFDEAFNDLNFQWDTIFMVAFARYGEDFLPSIESLDNFYARQRPDGTIRRIIDEQTGSDEHEWAAGRSAINPPLFAWAEMLSFRHTNDLERLRNVFPALEKYAEYVERERKAAKSPHGLYWNDRVGSGMDNIPLSGSGWVDMSCQVAFQYRQLAKIAHKLGNDEKTIRYKQKADEISTRINKHMWDPVDGFYYNLDDQGIQLKTKTVAAFWALISEVADKQRAKSLISYLESEQHFWRETPFPSLSASDPDFDASGAYWRGGVWAPTNLMIINGLEKSGFHDLANKASKRYLNALANVYETTGSLWEMYAPDASQPGTKRDGETLCKKDFVGWTGNGPITMLIEHILGISIDAENSLVNWRINEVSRHGIHNLKIGGNTINLICEKREHQRDPVKIQIKAKSPLTISIIVNDIKHLRTIPKGKTSLILHD